MRQSASITNIVAALAEAQKKIEPAKKDTEGQIGTRPYKYADLAACRAAYRAPLAEHGIFVVHSLTPVDGHIVLTTTLQHTSAEWLASDVPIPVTLKPQDFGSALTYYRRYNVSAMLDLAAEDDDGKAAQDAATKDASGKQTPAKVEPPKPAVEPAPAPKSELTHEEINTVQLLAKSRGYMTSGALAPVLSNILRGVTKASDIPRKDLPVVLDALKAMREKVPA